MLILSCIYDGSFPVPTVVDTKRRVRALLPVRADNDATALGQSHHGGRRSTEDGGWMEEEAEAMHGHGEMNRIGTIPYVLYLLTRRRRRDEPPHHPHLNRL